jgi:hypothetical protein
MLFYRIFSKRNKFGSMAGCRLRQTDIGHKWAFCGLLTGARRSTIAALANTGLSTKDRETNMATFVRSVVE